MKPTFRATFGQGIDHSGGHPLLGKFGAQDDNRAHTSSPMLSQGFSQRGDPGLGALPARASQQHNLLLSQPLSQPLASQVLFDSIIEEMSSALWLYYLLRHMHHGQGVSTVSFS